MEGDRWGSSWRLHGYNSMDVQGEGLGECSADSIPLSLSKIERVTGKRAHGEENEGVLGSVKADFVKGHPR